MVLLIIIPTKWLFHWGYTPFSDIPMYLGMPSGLEDAGSLEVFLGTGGCVEPPFDP